MQASHVVSVPRGPNRRLPVVGVSGWSRAQQSAKPPSSPEGWGEFPQARRAGVGGDTKELPDEPDEGTACGLVALEERLEDETSPRLTVTENGLIRGAYWKVPSTEDRVSHFLSSTSQGMMEVASR